MKLVCYKLKYSSGPTNLYSDLSNRFFLRLMIVAMKKYGIDCHYMVFFLYCNTENVVDSPSSLGLYF